MLVNTPTGKRNRALVLVVMRGQDGMGFYYYFFFPENKKEFIK